MRNNVAIFEQVWGPTRCCRRASSLTSRRCAVPARSGATASTRRSTPTLARGWSNAPAAPDGRLPLLHASSTPSCATTRQKRRETDRSPRRRDDRPLAIARRAHNLSRAFLYEHAARDLRDYPILGVDPKEVVLRSYTPEGFYLDHSTMVHHTDVEPWRANKLGKRLPRYAAFHGACSARASRARVPPRWARCAASQRAARSPRCRPPRARWACARWTSSCGARRPRGCNRRATSAPPPLPAHLHGHLDALVRAFEGAQRLRPTSRIDMHTLAPSLTIEVNFKFLITGSSSNIFKFKDSFRIPWNVIYLEAKRQYEFSTHPVLFVKIVIKILFFSFISVRTIEESRITAPELSVLYHMI